MNKRIFFLLSFLPALLFAQQEVVFPDDFQTDALNGKEVTITNTLTLSNNYSYQTGSITLSVGLLWTPTEKNLPGVEMFAEQNEANRKNQLTVKAGAFSFIDSDATCRIGQTITGVTGKASYSSGKYTLTLTKKPEFTGNERPTSCTTSEPYNMKVVSFNTEHFNASGANFDTQLNKISLALNALQADVYALAEIEGSAGLEALRNRLNTMNGTEKYQIRTPGNYSEAMTAFIYDSEKVIPVAALSMNKLANNYLPYRKVAQGFQLLSNGERVIICCNHWKAKTSTNKTDGDQDQGDGQATFNARRVQEAEATLAFLEEIKKTYNDPDVLVVGDLNAYTREDPIRILEEGGLKNQLTRYAPQSYSYAYYSNGSYAVGYLDHSLVTASLESQVVDAKVFHINADEPDKLSLKNKDHQPNNMYRCSDHNPIVTFLNLSKQETGIEDALASSLSPIILSGNPSSGSVEVSFASYAHYMTRIELISINGEIKSAYRLPGYYTTFTLPLADLAKGIYLIRVFDEQGSTYICKFIIS